MKSKKSLKYKVVYNSDPRYISDNHDSEAIYLIDVDEKMFDKIGDAIKFLNECTSPITKAEDLLPELLNFPEFEWVIAECNIKSELILIGDIQKAVQILD